MYDLFQLFISTLPGFLEAALLTIKISLVGVILGTVLGLIFALFKVSKWKTLQVIANFYITLVRGTPLIVQISFLYFGISTLIVLTDFWAGGIALGIHNGAYIAEIFRGSIKSIERGQNEAARSLGMTSAQTMRRIIFPQAFKLSIPPLANQFIIALKDSSLVYVIGVAEIYSIANSTAAATFKQFESYMIAGFYYLVLVIIFTFLVQRLEKKLDVDKA